MIPDQTAIRAAYKKAPKRVQKYITSIELDHAFKEIGTTHKLHLDESGALSKALNAVFLELVPLEKFPDLLKEVLKDNSKQAAVLKEVNEKVFVTFRKKLQEPEPEPEPKIEAAEEEKPEDTVEVAPKPAEDKIASIEKTISLEKPTPTVAPIPSSAPDKLTDAVSEKPVDIEIPSVNETKKPDESSQYTGGGDPYREPIE